MSALRKSAELAFGWETIFNLLRTDSKRLADLFFAHWEEVGVHKVAMPLAPDWARFIALNEAGIVRVWTARDPDTGLVGYLTWYIQTHIDYCTTLHAEMGPYFLAPEARKGLAGLHMFETSIAQLREMGVKRLVGHSRVGKLDAIFKRLGFDTLDTTWDRIL